MRHTFNKVYLFVTALLFAVGIILGEEIIQTRGTVPLPRTLLTEASAEENVENTPLNDAPENAGAKSKDPIAQVFFDRSFLSIEESLILQKRREIGTQTKVAVSRVAPAPRNVLITDVKNGELVTITWDIFIAPPQKVLIFRSDDGGASTLVGEVAGAEPGYHDTAIKIGSRYSYTLQSLSEDGEKSETRGPFIAGPIEDLVPPTPPFLITYTFEDNGVILKWSDPTATDLDHISIYRSSVKGDVGEKIYEVLPGVQTYTDAGVEDGRTYYYFLKSEDKNGNQSINEIVEKRVGNPAIFTPVF